MRLSFPKLAGTDDELSMRRPVAKTRIPALVVEADARTRTGDPIITSDVLYQLSYVGLGSRKSSPPRAQRTAC